MKLEEVAGQFTGGFNGRTSKTVDELFSETIHRGVVSIDCKIFCNVNTGPYTWYDDSGDETHIEREGVSHVTLSNLESNNLFIDRDMMIPYDDLFKADVVDSIIFFFGEHLPEQDKRIYDVEFTKEEATQIFNELMKEVNILNQRDTHHP